VIELEEVVASWGDDDPTRYIAIADHFLRLEDKPAAAAALDRAYGLAPDDVDLARHRMAILDELAVYEHGIVWRYIPAGTFLMGSDSGDPDERPVHPRRVDAFWIADVPITWAQFNTLLGWKPAPHYGPELPQLTGDQQWNRRLRMKIRMQYCESSTLAARDWHAHAGMHGMTVPRTDASEPNRYDVKPLAAACHDEAALIEARYANVRLPSEHEWEKAARGGLVGKRYAWGDDPPTRDRCDCDRMGDFQLLDPRVLPPNGYGLYGMCGGVSELTRDIYDALLYHRGGVPSGPQVVPDEFPGPREYVLRGGSFVDCAAAVTVSYRMSREADARATPTIGMRLVRTR
jgi:formylglycine-generating enzyme required for sulfatase activity